MKHGAEIKQPSQWNRNVQEEAIGGLNVSYFRVIGKVFDWEIKVPSEDCT